MEMVDLYDENRLPLGRTAERYAPKGEGEYRVVVHICVFDSRGRLLIQQRSREKAVWPEAWDVSAAGGVDAGETSRQAAEQEFREELGVALDLTGVRPSCTVNFDGGFDDFFLVERDLGLEELTLQKEEVAQARWAELPEILDMVDRGSSSTIPKAFWRFCSTCGGPSASAPNEAPPGPKLQCFFGKRP
ncbi:MAG: NUDIX hydrolase [Dysosmobacter welbionis]|uniref:NUDIX hydrolase n=1 Tax=Dysosmobacter welbionis TaxID=2093857 RepID=UPI003992F0DC